MAGPRPGACPVRRTPTRRAELAAAGLRNQEIAERVFASPKTVEATLSRAYRKLSIRSRAELVRALQALGSRSPE